MDASKPGIDDKYRFKHDNLTKGCLWKKKETPELKSHNNMNKVLINWVFHLNIHDKKQN